MAQIGKFKTRDTISMDVGRAPTRSRQEAGMVGKSIQNLGSTVSRSAQMIGELEMRKKAAKNTGEASDRFDGISTELYKLRKSGELDAQGTDYNNYSEGFKKESEELIKGGLSGASPEVAAMVQKKLTQKMAKLNFDAKVTEDSGNIKYNKNKRDINLKETINTAYSVTDYEAADEKFIENLKGTAEQTAIGIYDETSAAKYNSRLPEIGEMSVRGDLANNMPAMSGILDPKGKKDYVDTLFESYDVLKAIDPKTKKQLKDSAYAVAEKQVLESDNRISKGIDEVSDIASGEGPYDPRVTNGLKEIGAEIANIQDPRKRELAAIKYVTAMKINAVKGMVGDATQEDLDQLQTGASSLLRDNSSFVSIKESEAATKQLTRMVESTKKKRETDAATEIYKSRPDLIGNSDATLEHAESLGISNSRALTNTQAEQSADAIMEGVNSKEKFQFMMGEMAKHSRQDTKVNVMQHMIDKGDLPKSYLYAARVSDSPTLARNIIRLGGKRKKEVNTDFATNRKDVSRTFNATFSRILGPKLEAFSGKSNGLGDSISDTVMTRAKERMTKDTSLDSDKAIRDSWDEIVSGQMSIIPIRSGKIAALAVTPTVEQDIKNFDNISGSKYLMDNLDIERQPLSYTKDRDEFLKEIGENGIWQANKSGDGLELVYQQEYGVRPVKDAKGKAIDVKFSTMNTWVIGQEFEGDTQFMKEEEQRAKGNWAAKYAGNR